ncbi:MAG: mannose-6-phosphate isomerase, class I [bacterium]|nr:mannose-6-phosphate isomerase, class I [bacterium]
MPKIVELRGDVRDYAWGSTTFLAESLGIENPDGGPQAELWMGAHRAAPSCVADGGRWVSLADWIAADPQARLGARCVDAFGDELPFLFKALAAARPLSLQAHPDAAQARAGFERENRAGLALDDPRRNYRDARAKPELLCALCPFDALLGFREVADIVRLLAALEVEGLRAPLDRVRQGGEAALRDFVAGPWHDGLTAQIAASCRARSDDEAYELVAELAADSPDDAGIVAPLLLNIVHLQAGQAIFVPEGELHSYLRGAGVELMGSSDNVLRGGLTDKHVDTGELLEILSFRTGAPAILEPTQRAPGEWVYETPAPPFELARIEVSGESVRRNVDAIELLLCSEGRGRITQEAGSTPRELARGSSVVVPADVAAYRIEGELRVFRASLPAG